MANEFLGDLAKNTAAGGTVGSLFGPKGTAVGMASGASLTILSEAAKLIKGTINTWQANQEQYQQILNRMVEDGYKIDPQSYDFEKRQLKSGLKLPKDAKISGGQEFHNPAPVVMFDQKNGRPELGLEYNERTVPKDMKNLPIQKSKIPLESLNEANARYYSGESGFPTQKLFYPDIKLEGEEGFNKNEPHGTFAEKEIQDKFVPKTAQENDARTGTNFTNNPNNPNSPNNPNNPFLKGEGGDWWRGRTARFEQIPRFTPTQGQYQQETIDELRRNKPDFEKIREAETRRLHEDILPQISQQYFGSHPNSFGSSYAEGLGRGASRFGLDLASRQAQFGAEREGRLQNVAMQPAFDVYREPRQSGAREELLNVFKNNPEMLSQGATEIGNWVKGFFGNNQQQQQQPQVDKQTYQQQQGPPSDELSQYNQNLTNPAMHQDVLNKQLQRELEKKDFKLGGRDY